MTHGNDWAYPVVEQAVNPEVWNTYPGLTKRELFAAMAMQGLCASLNEGSWSYEQLSEYSVKHADALIKELNKYV